jgi:hypothetical protein
MPDQVAHGGFVRVVELQVAVLDIPYQQAFAFQVCADALADRLDSFVLICASLYSVCTDLFRCP